MTWSMPGNSSSGNMRPQSTAMRSSPDSTSIMLRPISPSPPRGMSRTEGSTKLLSRRRVHRITRVGFPEVSPRPRASFTTGDGVSRVGGAGCGPVAAAACDGPRPPHVTTVRERCALQRRGVLEAAHQLARQAQELGALGGWHGLAGDELLGERVHEPAAVGDAVVEVRPRAEPGRADVTDDLALPHARARAHARGEAREVVVLGLVARAVAELDLDAAAAGPARARDDAVGHGAHRRAGRRR